VGHRDAAGRHGAAAEQYERAARFWDEQQDPERAGLQRVLAAYERLGAELERRWAELIDPDADSEARAAELVTRHTRQGAKQASAVLMQLATTLERSAGLAEEHAQRRERAGRADDAVAEHKAAQRARQAAERARSQADEWMRVGEKPHQLRRARRVLSGCGASLTSEGVGQTIQIAPPTSASGSRTSASGSRTSARADGPTRTACGRARAACRRAQTRSTISGLLAQASSTMCKPSTEWRFCREFGEPLRFLVRRLQDAVVGCGGVRRHELGLASPLVP
jgi:hypothetical protein